MTSYTLAAVLFAVSIPVFLIAGCRLLDCCLNVVHAFMVARQVGERPVVRWDDEQAAS